MMHERITESWNWWTNKFPIKMKLIGYTTTTNWRVQLMCPWMVLAKKTAKQVSLIRQLSILQNIRVDLNRKPMSKINDNFFLLNHWNTKLICHFANHWKSREYKQSTFTDYFLHITAFQPTEHGGVIGRHEGYEIHLMKHFEQLFRMQLHRQQHAPQAHGSDVLSSTDWSQK